LAAFAYFDHIGDINDMILYTLSAERCTLNFCLQFQLSDFFGHFKFRCFSLATDYTDEH